MGAEQSFRERVEEAKNEVSEQIISGSTTTIINTLQESKVDTLDDLGNVLSVSLATIVSDVIVPSLAGAMRNFEPELTRIEELLQSIPELKVEHFDPNSLPVTVLDKDYDSCAICIEDMKKGEEVIETQCNHFFHRQCILLWFNRSHLCPLCRCTQQGQ